MEFFPGERWTEEECRASLAKEEVCPKFSGQGRPEIASVISGFFGLEEERNRVRRDKYRGSMQARILFGGINVCDAESSNKKEEDTLHVSSNWSIFLGPWWQSPFEEGRSVMYLKYVTRILLELYLCLL